MKLDPLALHELMYGDQMRRYTQDSPVLPDVWTAYAEQGSLDAEVELLLTPYYGQSAASLAKALNGAPNEEHEAVWEEWHQALEHGIDLVGDSSARASADSPSPRIAFNQAAVLARFTFHEMIQECLPLSSWWLRLARLDHLKREQPESDSDSEAVDRGRLLLADPELQWMALVLGSVSLGLEASARPNDAGHAAELWDDIVKQPEQAVSRGFDLLIALPAEARNPLLFSISCNRKLEMSVARSVPAIKADAAQRLFDIRCRNLTWAVIDSGIDAEHPAFRVHDDEAGDDGPGESATDLDRSRVVRTYDFTLVKALLNLHKVTPPEVAPELLARLKTKPDIALTLRRRLLTGREVDWELLEPFLRMPHQRSGETGGYRPPLHRHGTHVAGILAADWQEPDDEPLRGICPDLRLLDLRVFDDQARGDEFTVMAALQFVRWLNANQDEMVVHGANLSLSLLHDVANYACGKTPVCEECDRAVNVGVVVVVAAGNRGYLRPDKPGQDAWSGGYRTVSITDPGNAEGVITVGSTHRFMPHVYGVSYFSSRGPTGDGRPKPDLVAPGEKIEAPVPGDDRDRMDGTSMAAAHVSGAAALLMARHLELIGEPARVKQILCDTATDLGRERHFQGSGMLDVLRALQAV